MIFNISLDHICGYSLGLSQTVKNIDICGNLPTNIERGDEKMAEERVIGTIPDAAEKKGFLGGEETFNMVITDRRIIGARSTPGLERKTTEKAGEEAFEKAKAEGKGFLKQMWAQASAGRQVHKRYENMDPEEILREDKKNFAWEYGGIKSIELKRRGRLGIIIHSVVQSEGGLSRKQHESKLIIEPISGKSRTFTFNVRHFDEAKDMLKQSAGSKLR